ncbi:DUF6355 family natural product biosynthesis protein [Haloechinothrix halophila]|uniref:DUF6355 family natural product biosynthesis protein n=1 Tax=Haloechinothrix halophila TaxID=1069073 RepID=UPI0012F7B59D|nr:DUF6355 family natural product biosynthesis protein [Haloechinothrix halophila]
MSKTIRRAVLAAAVAAGALTCAVPASAADSTVQASAPCGYIGYKGSNGHQPLYNHCGRYNVVVEVDHLFWQTTYACVKPGVHHLPQGSSQWRIIYADSDGRRCANPGPIARP